MSASLPGKRFHPIPVASEVRIDVPGAFGGDAAAYGVRGESISTLRADPRSSREQMGARAVGVANALPVVRV